MKTHKHEKQHREILELLRSGPATNKEVAAHLFKTTNSHHVLVAEELLDEMWDLELCTNMGEFHDYKYRITDIGEQFRLLNG